MQNVSLHSWNSEIFAFSRSCASCPPPYWRSPMAPEEASVTHLVVHFIYEHQENSISLNLYCHDRPWSLSQSSPSHVLPQLVTPGEARVKYLVHLLFEHLDNAHNNA